MRHDEESGHLVVDSDERELAMRFLRGDESPEAADGARCVLSAVFGASAAVDDTPGAPMVAVQLGGRRRYTDLRRELRDKALRAAAALLWARDCKASPRRLKEMWDAFLSGGSYRHWRGPTHPPAYVCGIERALYYASDLNGGESLSVDMLEIILGKEWSGFEFPGDNFSI